MADRDSVSHALNQRQVSLNKRSSVNRDAREFESRQGSVWADSSLINRCMACQTKFSLTTRKHHCRECGQVFCSSCSCYKVVVQGRMKRACELCYRAALQNAKPQSHIPASQPVFYSGDRLSQQQQNMPTQSGAFNPMGGDLSSLPDDKLPPWVEAILFARTSFESSGSELHNVRTIFPSESRLSAEMQQEILHTGLSCVTAKKEFRSMHQKFMFRVRDKTLPGFVFKDEESDEVVGTAVTKTTEFFNCFCLFSQQMQLLPTESGVSFYRQAVILVSRWPFPSLAYAMLDHLLEAIELQCPSAPPVRERADSDDSSVFSVTASGWKEFSSPDSPGNGPLSPSNTFAEREPQRELNANQVSDICLVAMSQVDLWPKPRQGALMYLIFFGDVLSYHVPSDLLTFSVTNLSPATTLSTLNLVSLFGPLGLLQHVWTLWELVVTGRDIVVIAPTAAMCADVVQGIAALIAPSHYVGDFRPFLAADDSDLLVMAATAQLKANLIANAFAAAQGDAEAGTAAEALAESASKILSRQRSMVVGVTDPEALLKLHEFSAAIFLTQPWYSAQQDKGVITESDAAYRGLRTKNSAEFLSLTLAERERDGPKVFHSQFLKWLDSAKDGSGRRKPMVVSKGDTSSLTLPRILTRVKNMHPDERCVLGDKLIRDNLRELTMAFFSPSAKQTGGGASSADKDSTQGQRPRLTGATSSELLAESEELEQQRVDQRQAREVESRGMIDLARQDIQSWLLSQPDWILSNMPTVLMWAGIVLCYILLYLVGTPLVVLIVTAVLVKIPERPSLQMELYMRAMIPTSILYPKSLRAPPPTPSAKIVPARSVPVVPPAGTVTATRSSLSTESPTVTTTVSVTASDASTWKREDLSGVWRRVRADNYEAFVGAQGAGLMQRKLAASIPLVHTITMDGALTMFRLQEKGGPIDSDNVYSVGGPEVATVFVKAHFLDRIYWSDEGQRPGLTLKKVHMPEQDYELVVTRWIERERDNKRVLKSEATYRCLKTDKRVVALTTFEYVGPSPNAPPPSLPPPTAASTAETTAPSTAESLSPSPPAQVPLSLPALSGVWQRTRTHNFEAFAGAGGAGFVQRKMAATMSLTHTIAMDAHGGVRACRLLEKGGPIDTDCTFNLGADFVDFNFNGKPFKQRMYWAPGETDGERVLVLQRRPRGDDKVEFLFTRSLDPEAPPDKPQIVLRSVHRDLVTHKETAATSWFSKVSECSLSPPEPDPTQSLDTATVPIGSSNAVAAVVDEDDENDDDEVAISRMHTRTEERRSEMQSRLLGRTNTHNLDITPRFTSVALGKTQTSAASPNASDQLAKALHFHGLWTLIAHQHTSTDAPVHRLMVSGSGERDKAGVVLGTVKVIESNAKGKIFRDYSLPLCGAVALSDKGWAAMPVRDGEKRCRGRCYLDGEALVVQVQEEGVSETMYRRELENNGKLLKLIVEERNKDGGAVTKSVTLSFIKS